MLGEGFRLRLLTIFGMVVGLFSRAAVFVLTRPFGLAPIVQWLFMLVGAPALALVIHMGVGITVLGGDDTFEGELARNEVGPGLGLYTMNNCSYLRDDSFPAKSITVASGVLERQC